MYEEPRRGAQDTNEDTQRIVLKLLYCLQNFYTL